MQRLLAGATAQISAGCPILRASEGENSDVCFGLVIPQPFLTERLGHPNVSIAWWKRWCIEGCTLQNTGCKPVPQRRVA